VHLNIESSSGGDLRGGKTRRFHRIKEEPQSYLTLRRKYCVEEAHKITTEGYVETSPSGRRASARSAQESSVSISVRRKVSKEKTLT
jgi:hypothetical protein